MSGSVLVLGSGTFLLCLGIHIIAWRRCRIRRHIIALFSIFFLGGLLVFMLFSYYFPGISQFNIFAAGLLHIALSCGYIQLYPASQANSPSVTLLLAVHDAMPAGLTEIEIQARLDSSKILQDRVEDLLVSGLVEREKGELSLTMSGRAFIFPFIYFRKLLGIPAGKG